MMKFEIFEIAELVFATVTGTVAPVATCAVVTAAVNVVEFTNVVGSAVLPNITCEPGTKFDPFTVSVKLAAPAVTVDGDRLVMAGPVIVTVTELEGAPVAPGCSMVTGTAPGVESNAAGTSAEAEVSLLTVVGRAIAVE